MRFTDIRLECLSALAEISAQPFVQTLPAVFDHNDLRLPDFIFMVSSQPATHPAAAVAAVVWVDLPSFLPSARLRTTM